MIQEAAATATIDNSADISFQLQVSKLQHKISLISTVSVPPSNIAQSASRSMLCDDFLRQLPISFPHVSVQPILQIKNGFHKKVLQPKYYFPSEEVAVAKSNILQKSTTNTRSPERTNSTGKVQDKQRKNSSITAGNDLRYFNNVFAKKSEDKNIGNSKSTSSSQSDRISSTDKIIIARHLSESPPITVRLPVLPIVFDDSSEVLNAPDQDKFDTAEIRRTLGVLETDGSVDINSYDDHTKEEFFQRSKMIAKESDNSVEVHFLPSKAPATAGLQEGRLDIIDLSNIASREM